MAQVATESVPRSDAISPWGGPPFMLVCIAHPGVAPQAYLTCKALHQGCLSCRGGAGACSGSGPTRGRPWDALLVRYVCCSTCWCIASGLPQVRQD